MTLEQMQEFFVCFGLEPVTSSIPSAPLEDVYQAFKARFMWELLGSGGRKHPTAKDLSDCLDFWNHYSSIDESAQDAIEDEKNAMLKRMAGWLTPSPT